MDEMDKSVKIWVSDKVAIHAPYGANLRKVLKDHFDFLYHPKIKNFHCRGLGSCGTCAVSIQGKVSAPTSMERWRLLTFLPIKPL